MKILLVNPPPRRIVHENIVTPPLGLAYLGAVLEGAGHDIEILDAFALQQDWLDFEETVKATKADIIGIGGMTPVIDNTFRAIKLCRRYCKYIVAGGPHVTIFKREIFNQCPEIDFAVIGEGEEAVVELFNAIEKGRNPSGIKGIATKDVVNPARKLVKRLDDLPFPARHLLPNYLYKYPLTRSEKITTMFTSRGCPYNCIFCDKSVFGHKWRARTPENVLEELEEIVEKYSIHSVIIYDDLFTIDRKRVIEICKGIIERRLEIDWKCESRVEMVDEDLLRWMKHAGCTMIAYGVETGNQKGLDYLNKRTTVEQIKRAFRLTHNAGIKTMAYFILGIPVETYDDELKGIKFAKEIRPSFAQFSVLSPLPGTRIYEEAIEKGWYKEIDAQNPLDKDLKRPAIISENWSEEDLKKIVKVAHIKFYLTPRYILKKILELTNFKQFIHRFKLGIDILKWYLRG